MSRPVDIAIFGAGPYGLAAAAHLSHRHTAVFGKPLETWKTRMPKDMTLRAAWHEMTLTTPSGAGDLEDWLRSTSRERVEPMSVSDFIDYAQWYRERFVPTVVESDVESVESWRDGFVVRSETGDEVTARAIVIAVGITPFPYVPEAFRRLDSSTVTFAVDRTSYADLAQRSLVIVGGGQTALEAAALALRQGAQVELLVRGSVRWFADREPHRQRSALRQRLYSLAYPVVGYGPPPVNRLALHPDLFAALPHSIRSAITARLLRAGGSAWLRPLLEGRVRITEEVNVVSAEEQADRTMLLRLDDGSDRVADGVVLATGYRFDLDRLRFLSPSVRHGIAVDRGWPRLDRYFGSSDPRISFVGYAAEGRIGPVARFVLGVPFTARRLASALNAGD